MALLIWYALVVAPKLSGAGVALGIVLAWIDRPARAHHVLEDPVAALLEVATSSTREGCECRWCAGTGVLCAPPKPEPPRSELVTEWGRVRLAPPIPAAPPCRERFG
jgi:hypothetical protein